MIRAELKAQAKAQLKGNVGMLFLCSLIVYAIGILCCMIPVVGAIASLIITPGLSIGLLLVYLDLSKNLDTHVSRLFDGFRYWGKALWLMILVSVFTFLWALLLYVPGIIKAISYSMSYYILAENPEMTAREALNESKEIMKGNKLNFFILELSFFFWLLLVVVTFGIAAIYVEPYMQLTYANFYHNIKRQPAAEAVYEEPVYDAPVAETAEDVIE